MKCRTANHVMVWVCRLDQDPDVMIFNQIVWSIEYVQSDKIIYIFFVNSIALNLFFLFK